MHFYVSTSMLILGFVLFMTRYAFVSDHWQYFGCMSVIALAAAGIATFLGRCKGWVKSLAIATGLTMLLLLGALTWRQCAMYVDVETVWRTTIARNPGSWIAHTNLGAALLRRGQLDEAFVNLQRGVGINPRVSETNAGFASALMQKGRPDEAAAYSQRALEADPDSVEAHGNLGAALLQLGRIDEAVIHLRKALELDPSLVEAHSNLGYVLLQTGDVAGSLAHLQQAVEVEPDYTPAHYNMANTLLKMGRAEEAVSHLQKVLTIDPNDAEAANNLAWVLATWPEERIRDGGKAIELAQRARHLMPGRAPIFAATLAAAYAETGRFSDAVKTAEDTLQWATTSGDKALADEIRAQIGLYKSGQPFRDKR
jgi:Flp pilus assembly protein TadD